MNSSHISDIIVLFLAILIGIVCAITSVVCVITEDYPNAVAALVLYVVAIVCIVADRKSINKHRRNEKGK